MEPQSSDYPRTDPKRFSERTPGRKIAEAVACVVIFLLIGATLCPLYSTNQEPRRTLCLSNVKQMTLGFLMYANDYDGVLPDAGHWMDTLAPYTKHEDLFHDSLAHIRPPECGYAFRSSASRLDIDTIKSQPTFALDFDSDLLARNASSDLSSLPRPGRHDGMDVIGYADGHAKSVKIGRIRTSTNDGE